MSQLFIVMLEKGMHLAILHPACTLNLDIKVLLEIFTYWYTDQPYVEGEPREIQRPSKMIFKIIEIDYITRFFSSLKTYQNIESITFKLTVVRCCLYN